jgi:YgiT-type zinc finger domain-containing protein
MKCTICKASETIRGTVTVTLERESVTLIIKDVPAQICNNCGEEYVDEKISAKLLLLAEEAVKAGVQVDIRKFVA